MSRGIIKASHNKLPWEWAATGTFVLVPMFGKVSLLTTHDLKILWKFAVRNKLCNEDEATNSQKKGRPLQSWLFSGCLVPSYCFFILIWLFRWTCTAEINNTIMSFSKELLSNTHVLRNSCNTQVMHFLFKNNCFRLGNVILHNNMDYLH